MSARADAGFMSKLGVLARKDLRLEARGRDTLAAHARLFVRSCARPCFHGARGEPDRSRACSPTSSPASCG